MSTMHLWGYRAILQCLFVHTRHVVSLQNVYYSNTQLLHIGLLSPTVDDDDNKCLVDVNSRPRLIECSYATAKRMKLHWLFTQVTTHAHKQEQDTYSTWSKAATIVCLATVSDKLICWIWKKFAGSFGYLRVFMVNSRALYLMWLMFPTFLLLIWLCRVVKTSRLPFWAAIWLQTAF